MIYVRIEIIYELWYIALLANGFLFDACYLTTQAYTLNALVPLH